MAGREEQKEKFTWRTKSADGRRCRFGWIDLYVLLPLGIILSVSYFLSSLWAGLWLLPVFFLSLPAFVIDILCFVFVLTQNGAAYPLIQTRNGLALLSLAISLPSVLLVGDGVLALSFAFGIAFQIFRIAYYAGRKDVFRFIRREATNSVFGSKEEVVPQASSLPLPDDGSPCRITDVSAAGGWVTVHNSSGQYFSIPGLLVLSTDDRVRVIASGKLLTYDPRGRVVASEPMA